MSDADERVFNERGVRRDGLLSAALAALVPPVAVAAGLLVRWLIGGAAGGWFATLCGAVVAAGLLFAAVDYLSLGWFNRRLRRKLLAKLRALGELTFNADDPTVYFVGLAHPSRSRGGRWETDDEIGFLHVTFDGLAFRGDRLVFDVPFSDLVAVELEPVGHGLPRALQRIRVQFAAGEPFDELFICGREGDRLTRGNAVTATLYEALTQRLKRRSGSRLTESAEGSEPALESLRWRDE